MGLDNNNLYPPDPYENPFYSPRGPYADAGNGGPGRGAPNGLQRLVINVDGDGRGGVVINEAKGAYIYVQACDWPVSFVPRIGGSPQDSYALQEGSVYTGPFDGITVFWDQITGLPSSIPPQLVLYLADSPDALRQIHARKPSRQSLVWQPLQFANGVLVLLPLGGDYRSFEGNTRLPWVAGGSPMGGIASYDGLSPSAMQITFLHANGVQVQAPNISAPDATGQGASGSTWNGTVAQFSIPCIANWTMELAEQVSISNSFCVPMPVGARYARLEWTGYPGGSGIGGSLTGWFGAS